MSVPKPKHAMPRFLERFSCVGSACEETCCQGWKVIVDERHYLKLKHAMDKDKADREKFRESHQRVKGEGKSPQNYAFIIMQDDGTCPMLDEKKLCSAQKRFGSEVLSDTCALYPRLFSQHGDAVEISAALSCPEMSRQALLHSDSMDLIDVPAEQLARRMITQGMAGDERDPYLSQIDDVRAFVLQLLSQRQYSVSARLFFVTYFANRTQKWFTEKQGPEVVEQLRGEMQRLLNAEVLDGWAKQFATIEPGSPLAASLVIEVLRQRLVDMPDGSFRQLIATVLLGSRRAQPAGAVDVSLSETWAKHQRQKQYVEERFGPALDLIFENYAKHYWFREWYARSPNLFVHARKLLVRMAVLRFLLISHPDIETIQDVEGFNKLAVETFYKFSRGVEHSAGFLVRIEKILEENHVDTLAHAIFLLKF